MESRSFRLHNGQKGAALTVRVIPRARRNEVVEVLNDGTVKIRLAVSSSKGINQELVKFLSDTLDISADRIDIVAGDTGLDKLVTVLDLDATTLQARILQKLA